MAYGNRRLSKPDPGTAADMFHALLGANFIFNAVAVHGSALRAVGSFDETIMAAEDWELWLRLAASGFIATRAPGQHAIYRLHESQASNDEQQTARYVVSILEKVLRTYTLSPIDRQVVEHAHTRSQRALAMAEEAHPGLLILHRVLRLLMRMRGLIDWHRRPPRVIADAFADLDRRAAPSEYAGLD
jgi:GT2 family glycosyltransferase